MPQWWSIHVAGAGKHPWLGNPVVLERIGYRTGAKLMLHHYSSKLVLDQTLQEQGFFGNLVALSYTLVPTDLYAAWCFIRGIFVSEDSFAVDGVTGWRVHPLESICTSFRIAFSDWHLMANSTRAWRASSCQAVFKP